MSEDLHDPKIFEECQKAGTWPSDYCSECEGERGGACCKRYWHHHLHCCTHCGDDERNPKEWRFR